MTETLLSETAETAAPHRQWRRARLASMARFGQLMGTSLLFWAVQAALLTFDPGIGPGAHSAAIALPLALILSALAFAALDMILPDGPAGADRHAHLRGASCGALLASAHLITLFSLHGSPPGGASSVALLALALGIGGFSGAAASWIKPFASSAAMLASLCLLLGCGAASVHLAAVAGATGALPFSRTLALALTTLGAAGTGALGLGAYLADLDLLRRPETAMRRARFENLAELLPLPVAVTSADEGTVLFANRRFREQFGLAAGQSATELAIADAADRERFVQSVRRNGLVENFEAEVKAPDGSSNWVLIAGRSTVFDGKPAVLCGYHDISDRKMAEEALLTGEVRYALVSRAANDGIWDWDIANGTVYYSSRWRELAGVEAGIRLNSLEDWFSRVHPEDIDRLRKEIDDHLAGLTPQLDTEYRIRHGSGEYHWMQCRALVLRNGDKKPIRIAGSQSDITLRKTYEANLLNAAYEDRLTGINNRAFFTHLIDTRATGSLIAGTAILLCNIDQFSRVNDSLGTGAGDALLIAVARRLSQRALPDDALSRLGADEFAIWFNNLTDLDAAEKLALSILSDLCQPYTLGDIEMPVTISVGVALPTLGDALSGADLLRHARLALDHAKEQGGGRVELFDTPLLQETNLRRQMSRDLTNAERLGQIYMEYQPIVELSPHEGSRVIGFELLMRWRHPHLGLVMPGRFIPLAEESGLIGPLGLHALMTAARDMQRWIDTGLADEDCTISVNLSARQVSDRAGVARLLSAIDALEVPLYRIKLEITETVLMNDPEAMVDTLEALRQRGVLILLDDFGTGYSSLSYLHRFPLFAIKIDRSFVNRMVQAPEAFRLVRSIVELGHDLGLRVVAEGVETADEAERLRDLGCDYAQGYFFSQAVPAEMAAQLLARRVI